MEYVLMDIKNFLRKLENGQLEIEAGQWELHKTLSNMNKVVTDLKSLRDDVEDMRLSSLEQMGLIKELQTQLGKIQKMQKEEHPVTVSESSVAYERIYKRPVDGQKSPKGFKKRKCRIRSEEIIEITSQISNEKSESVCGAVNRDDKNCAEIEGTEITGNVNEQNSEDGTSADVYKADPYLISKQVQNGKHYPPHSANNDILQRYLKDSVKYIDRKASNSTEPTHVTSHRSEGSATHFWDEHSSRAQPEVHTENRNTKLVKQQSPESEIPPENILPKRFSCVKCPKKFMTKSDSFRHEKKHRSAELTFYCKTCGKGFASKERLKDHGTIHRISRTFKGFRCSYCGKICSTPEKLTSHLRKCRTIMKAHFKKK